MTKKIIGASEIACDHCGALPQERCTFMSGHSPRRKRQFRFGYHSIRVRSAQMATEALAALIGD